MSENPDLDELARKYLDLWQQHMSALAKDGETAEVLANTIAMMNTGAASFADTMAGAMKAAAEQAADPQTRSPTGTEKGSETGNGSPEDGTRGSAGNGLVDGASAASLAHGDPGADVDGLLERIAVLEERVSRLEGQDAKPTRTKKKA